MILYMRGTVAHGVQSSVQQDVAEAWFAVSAGICMQA